MSGALLSVENAVVDLPTPRGNLRAVDHVDLTVGAGRSLGVVGESGCGKTMLSRAVLQLLPKKAKLSGRVMFGGQDLTKLSAEKLRKLRGRSLEIGAGTGYYLAHTLDSIAGARGVGLDVSVPAAKHLAKSHPRVGAVVADVWEQLPIRTGSVHALAVVFAPRNPAEFARVLVDGGEAVMLVADQGHLDELREPLGILGVEDGKIERLVAQSAGHLAPAADPELIEFPMQLGRDAIAAQVGMSPSARHLDPEVLQARLAELPEQMEVTARAQLVRMRKA